MNDFIEKLKTPEVRRRFDALSRSIDKAGLKLRDGTITDMQARSVPLPEVLREELENYILKGDGNASHLTRLCRDALSGS